ncbi:MAG: hypothetical protein LBQ15_12885 [Clostridium sp.]|jgi:hypothetical protein|nr:hypothetical protein [Clostridium sp.]
MTQNALRALWGVTGAYLILGGFCSLYLVCGNKFYATTTWGNFSWGFAALLNNYLSIDKKSKKEYKNILYHDYSHFMRCFDHMISYDLKAEEVLVSNWVIPVRRSRILNT